MTDPALLGIDGLRAAYGPRVVIDAPSFNVSPREIFGLVGLNGAGKTTLIKTILGLKDPSSGAVHVKGFEAGTVDAKRQIAFLPERFEPAGFLNAYEFIEFSLSLHGKKAERAAVEGMAARLGLSLPALKARIQTYSKGMRQKLGLTSVFLSDCPLLILDEPMSGLDPLARAQVKRLLVDMRAQGRSVFFSSHVLSDMQELCDRIGVLHRGRLQFLGKPEEFIAAQGAPTLEEALLRLIETSE